MKTLDKIITYLFAFIYLLFGLNFFIGFLPMPELEGNALTYMSLLSSTGYMAAVKVLEIIVALMLIFKFKTVLAWLLILPISTNILMYDVFIVGIPTLGLLMVALNLYMVYRNRAHYISLVK